MLTLFGSLKAPKVTISLETRKENYLLGEPVTGSILIVPQEDFQASEVRVELRGRETLTATGEPYEGVEEGETLLTKRYSRAEGEDRDEGLEFPMWDNATTLSEATNMTQGSALRFPFEITIPPNLGPTFRGTRRDGNVMARTWTVRGTVAIRGRPDAKTDKEIQVGVMMQPVGVAA